MKTNIFKNSSLKFWKMMLMMEIGSNILLQIIQDLDTKSLQDQWLSSLTRKLTSRQKESSTRQKFIGSLTQMTPSMYIWTPPSYVVRKLSKGWKLLIQELYVKHAQVLQKPIGNNGLMKTLGNCPKISQRILQGDLLLDHLLKILGWRIVVAALVSKRAIIGMSLE